MKSQTVKTFIVAALVCLVFICGAPAPVAAQTLHPKLASGKTKIRRVVILPPKVEFVRQSVKGSESMMKESEEISTALVATLTGIFKEKRIAVVDSAMTPQKLADDEKIKYAVADVQQRYDALLPKMLKKTKDINKGRFTLGDEVSSLLAVDDDIDALIFIRAQGIKPTKGKSIVGLLQLAPSFPLVFANIGVVDARTGEVLLLAKPIAVGDATGNADKVLRKPLTKSLKKLPSVN